MWSFKYVNLHIDLWPQCLCDKFVQFVTVASLLFELFQSSFLSDRKNVLKIQTELCLLIE